jgi:hypothetical protein
MKLWARLGGWRFGCVPKSPLAVLHYVTIIGGLRRASRQPEAEAGSHCYE